MLERGCDGMEDIADSKSAALSCVWVRIPPPVPFLGSSMAESAAVNRVVVGSNPTRGAKILPSLIGRAIDSGSIRSSFESKGRSQNEMSSNG